MARGLEFGIAYGAEGKLGSRPLHKYAHYVGVRIQPVNRNELVAEQRAFSMSLRTAILEHLPVKDHGSNQRFAFWHDMPVGKEMDWDQWADEVIAALREIAQKMTELFLMDVNDPRNRCSSPLSMLLHCF